MFRSLASLLLPLLCQAAQSVPDTFRASHERGEASIRKGDLKAGVAWLRQAYTIDPGNYENAWDLATACVETKRLEEARRIVEALLKQGDRSELHNLLGEIEEGEGHVVEAVRQFETAARSDPTEKNVFDLGSALLNSTGFQPARLRVGLGIAYYSLSRYADAVETLCQAVDLNPRDTRALEFLGKMRDVAPEMGQDVRRRLHRFAALYPDNAAASYYYGLSLLDADDEAGAEARLLKAVALDPSFAEAHFQLGVLYQKRDEATKAVRELEAAVQLRHGLKAAHYRLAALYNAQGLTERAQRELKIFRALP
jgi:tetratricopeptide (TPR) repeat protein